MGVISPLGTYKIVRMPFRFLWSASAAVYHGLNNLLSFPMSETINQLAFVYSAHPPRCRVMWNSKSPISTYHCTPIRHELRRHFAQYEFAEFSMVHTAEPIALVYHRLNFHESIRLHCVHIPLNLDRFDGKASKFVLKINKISSCVSQLVGQQINQWICDR